MGWKILEPFSDNLVAGITTRGIDNFVKSKDQKNPFDSFNMGLHVGDNIENVLHSRKKMCRMLEFPFAGYTCAEQIHGDCIVAVDEILKGKGRFNKDNAILKCDALITNQPGILLNIFVADCVPIIFYDPIAHCCGVVHAGWRGVALNIVDKTIKKLSLCYESNPANLLIGIGPSIGLCCFDVEKDTANEILKDQEYSDKVFEKRDGRFFIDLRQCLQEQLERAGVENNSIEILRFCTKCCADRFYSYRASGGNTGRFSGFIGIR